MVRNHDVRSNSHKLARMSNCFKNWPVPLPRWSRSNDAPPPYATCERCGGDEGFSIDMTMEPCLSCAATGRDPIPFPEVIGKLRGKVE